jgi:biopolymer transport protein ExbD
MDFAPPPRRRAAENLLPMINVVFLLLVFFLITAKLAPPDPLPVTLPAAAAGQDAEGAAEPALYLGADGGLATLTPAGALSHASDAEAMAALAQGRAALCARLDCALEPPVLILRADAAAPAARLAELLPGLAAAGFAAVDLVTVRP